ncbi:class I SAM-dependent methyltransferase [Chloroflexota bacterium]
MEEHLDTRERIQRLESEERLKKLRPNELIKDLAGVTRGMTCVDLGCGTGTLSFPMVVSVGDQGIVYAVDNSAEMLEYIRAKNPPKNLKLVQCDASQTGLSSQIADSCLMALVLHDIEQPERVMAEAFRLLKPQGKAVVIELREDFDSPHHSRDKRIGREHVEQLFKQGGFSCFEYTNWSKSQYVATGIKSESA